MSEKRLTEIFRFKRIVAAKLKAFGFIEEGEEYRYRAPLGVNNFIIDVRVDGDGRLSAEVVDGDLNEAYTLHLTDAAVGSFIGDVRTAYENILTDIATECTEPQIFKTRQAAELIEYVRGAYGSKPEYLWERFPDNAVFRRNDTGKWYGIIMTVKAVKLGLEEEGTVEVLDLRAPEGFAPDGEDFLPGYHMNKKSWFTVILDARVSTETLIRLMDVSYRLATK